MSAPNYEAKIAGLLAKAEDKAATPEEAETYSKAAERLMVKWGISEAMARAAAQGTKAPTEPVIEERVPVKGAYWQGDLGIMSNVANGIGIRFLRSTGRGNTGTGYFIGHEGDVHRAILLSNSLRLQAHSARRKWWKAAPERAWFTHQEMFKANRQFLLSFGYAVSKRLRETTTEEAEAAGPGTELVLVDRKARVDEWLDEQYPKLRNGRGLSGGASGHAAGAEAGRSARLDTTSIGNTKGQLR